MVTPAGAAVTWQEDFTSDNWSSDSTSNYVDTTANKLIRDVNDSIWIQLPFTPEATSTGKFVVTYGYEIVYRGWASQSYFGMATHSNKKYGVAVDDNEWLSLIGNDWESAGGMRITARSKYSGSEVEINSSSNSSLASDGVVTYCKTIFDGAASDVLKTYFYSDADMTTPLTIGSNPFRNITELPSNWSDSESTWYLWSSGYSGYLSKNAVTPIKFYNGVNEI